MNRKRVQILLLILGIVIAAAGVVAVVMDMWVGVAAILGGCLLGVSGGIRNRTVNERFNPMVENGGHDGENINHHPDDVPLNPWDSITGNAEK